MTVPIRLPTLNQILLPSQHDGRTTETQHGQEQQQEQDTSWLEWQATVATTPYPRHPHKQAQQQQQQQQHPLDDAFSLLLRRKAPSVRFATLDQICYYEREPSGSCDEDPNIASEEGFQMDHVFDDVGTATAFPPLTPPRRCPSPDSVESHDDINVQEPHANLVLVRAGMPRHGSVESETTLSFSGHGDCCSSTQDEDTLSGEFNLEEDEEIVLVAQRARALTVNDDDDDSCLIREIMENLRVEGTTTSSDDCQQQQEPPA